MRFRDFCAGPWSKTLSCISGKRTSFFGSSFLQAVSTFFFRGFAVLPVRSDLIKPAVLQHPCFGGGAGWRMKWSVFNHGYMPCLQFYIYSSIKVRAYTWQQRRSRACLLLVAAAVVAAAITINSERCTYVIVSGLPTRCYFCCFALLLRRILSVLLLWLWPNSFVTLCE